MVLEESFNEPHSARRRLLSVAAMGSIDVEECLGFSARDCTPCRRGRR